MPCYITGSQRGDLELSYKESLEKAQEVTRILCDLCNTIDKKELEKVPAAVKWWQNHQKIDNKPKFPKTKERKPIRGRKTRG